jgi:hypothetical protein
MSARLTLAELVDGLTRLDDIFFRLDVFADDVEGLDPDRPSDRLRRMQPTSEQYFFEERNREFALTLSDEGIVRVTRVEDATAVESEEVTPEIHRAIATARRKKGAGWPSGLVLGIGVGGLIGEPGPGPRPRRMLTMRFDPEKRTWSAYDGGLVTWLKSEFLRAG